MTSPPAVALNILNCFFFFKPWITFPKSHKYDAQITDFISVNFDSIVWCFMFVVRRGTGAGAVAGTGTCPAVEGTEEESQKREEMMEGRDKEKEVKRRRWGGCDEEG